MKFTKGFDHKNNKIDSYYTLITTCRFCYLHDVKDGYTFYYFLN